MKKLILILWLIPFVLTAQTKLTYKTSEVQAILDAVVTKPARDSVVLKNIPQLPAGSTADTILAYKNGNVYWTIAASVTSYPNYYVSTSGNDINDGLSPTTPWRTLARAYDTTYAPGANIQLKRGDTWREQFTVPSSGTLTNRITLSAYGTGAKPIINAADVVTGWGASYRQYAHIWGAVNPAVSETYQVCVIDDSIFTKVSTLAAVKSAGKYWVNHRSGTDSIYVYSITDPDTRIAEVSNRNYCIYASQKSYLTITNIECRYGGRGGIWLQGPVSYPSQTLSYSIIDSCILHGNRIRGIEIGFGYANATVSNCIATYNGNGIIAEVGADNTTISHNYTAHSIHYTVVPITDGSGIQIYQSSNLIAEYNECNADVWGIYIDPKYYGTPQQDYWVGPYNLIARYNYVHDCYGGIGATQLALGDVISVYDNLIVNCGNKVAEIAAFYADGTCAGNAYLYNNSFVNHTDGANTFASIQLDYGAGYTIKNNIFYFVSNPTDYLRPVKVMNSGVPTMDYNAYYISGGTGYIRANSVTYSSLATWTTAHGQDGNSTQTNPLFTNATSNWTLQTGSPCINTGATISTIPPFDILHNPLNGIRDKGAYEKQ